MFSGGRAGAWRSKNLQCFMRNTQQTLIPVCCPPCVLFHIYCPTAEVQWGRMCMEGSESILSLLANPEFLSEFLSPIKISWPAARLVINTKYTSLNSTEIHPFQLCLSSCFTYSWQLGWLMSWQECFFLGTKQCWWLLCLLLGEDNPNNQEWITRAVVFSGFAFSIPGWVEGQD